MDCLTKNQGLHNISEKIFKNLRLMDLVKCRQVNTFWKQIVDQPVFLIKIVQISAKANNEKILKNQEYWKKIVSNLKNLQCSDNLTDRLILNHLVDKTIKYLWKTLGFIEKFDTKGDIPSPLHIATNSRDLEFIEFIMKIQPNLAYDYYKGFQAIHISISYNNLEMLKLLAGSFKNPTSFQISTGFSTLKWAIINDCYEIVKYLLQFELPHDLTNEIIGVSFTILYKMEPDKEEIRMKILELLTATKNYDVFRCDWILNGAVIKGRIEVVKLLLQKVDDPLNPNYFDGDNPIDLCLKYKPKGYERLVEFFKSFQ